MILIEVVLSGIIVIVSVISFFTDLTRGIVPNRLLLYAAGIGLILDSVYYGFLVSDVILEFLLNLSFVAVGSLLMFVAKIWGGGDTKLSLLLAFLFPARLYFYYRDEMFPILNAFIFAFSLGLIYLAVESIWLLCTGKERHRTGSIKETLSGIPFQYAAVFFLFLLLDLFIRKMIPVFYEDNTALFEILFMVLFFVLSEVSFFSKRWVCLLVAIGSLAVYAAVSGGFPAIHINDLMLIAVIHLIRMLLSWHNYKTVKITELKPGMILSTTSSIMIYGNEGNGIVRISREDMGDRLTEDEVASVFKWLDKHPNYETVSIVRKIPFSAFISLGYIVFLILGVLKNYEII